MNKSLFQYHRMKLRVTLIYLNSQQNYKISINLVVKSFSRHTWIHSLKRNKLTNDRDSKIAFIAHNNKIQSERIFESAKDYKFLHQIALPTTSI